MSEELNRLRNWAQGRARPSTGPLKRAEPDTDRDPAQAGNLSQCTGPGPASHPEEIAR